MENVYIITYYKPKGKDEKCKCNCDSFTYVVGKGGLKEQLKFATVNGFKNIRWHKISKKISGAIEKSFDDYSSEQKPVNGLDACTFDSKIQTVDLLRGEMLKMIGSKRTQLVYDRFIRKIHGGDEIWRIKCDNGNNGFVISRNGEVVDHEII